MSTQIIDAITTAIRPVIEAGGNYLEEVTIANAGKLRIITVIVDNDTYLNLDQVTAASREISEIIELLPELGESPFTLEVTSPGVDRPLTLPRHWRKNKGRLVIITTNDGSQITGRIGESTESSVVLESGEINFSDIKKAMIEIEFKSLKSEASE
jgi:ribosome maturation factor RimP